MTVLFLNGAIAYANTVFSLNRFDGVILVLRTVISIFYNRTKGEHLAAMNFRQHHVFTAECFNA